MPPGTSLDHGAVHGCRVRARPHAAARADDHQRPLGTGNPSSATFNFSDTEAGVTFLCKLDAGSYAACSNPATFSGLTDGSHNLSVQAKDAAGNISTTAASRTWSVDATGPPKPTILGPNNKSDSTAATFTITDAEAGVTFQCSLDGSPYTACTSPKTYTLLSSGTHVFDARAVDAAGNIGDFNEWKWTINGLASGGQPFTISGNAAGALYPGGAIRYLDLALTNPNGVTIYITSLTVAMHRSPRRTRTRPIPARPPSTSPSTQFGGGFPVILPPGTKTLSQLGYTQSQMPSITMLNRPRQPGRLQERHPPLRLHRKRPVMTRGIRFVYRSKRRLTLAAVLIVALAASLTAVAYWTTSGTGSRQRERGHADRARQAASVRRRARRQPELARRHRLGRRHRQLPRRAPPRSGRDLDRRLRLHRRRADQLHELQRHPGQRHLRLPRHSRYASWRTTGASKATRSRRTPTPPHPTSSRSPGQMVPRPTPARSTGRSRSASPLPESTRTTDGRPNGRSTWNGTGFTGNGTFAHGDRHQRYGRRHLGLDLVDDNSITDGASNPLGDSVGGANGNFTGQVYSIDKTNPSVTVNQKAGQADPTNTLPILYTVTFSESVTGFDASDLTRGGTATGGSVAVTGSGASYEIAVTDPGSNLTTGTISFTIGANKAQDAAGNNNTGSSSTDNTVTYDTVSPSTTIALSPASPTARRLVQDNDDVHP